MGPTHPSGHVASRLIRAETRLLRRPVTGAERRLQRCPISQPLRWAGDNTWCMISYFEQAAQLVFQNSISKTQMYSHLG